MKAGFDSRNWTDKGYSIGEGYKWLQGSMPDVRWTKWIWNNFNIPKHSFIAWIAIHDRLRLRNKLFKLGICEDEACLLCGTEPENLHHLDYSIENAWKIWSRGLKDPIKKKVVLAVLTALLYHIWLARNHSYWKKAVIHPEKLCKVICVEVIERSQ
ncbi:uncharacterized protein LOC110739587 [Chenopodium quinoa]|uniref:uncharacterized protein LOC110738503 n=1 Tax=Chenopodium quinoa TaxID=63459 RepID=UPI000B77AC13|nr:uncharacterized protein LOC110738503 [Chenopodium quinoa]XP_021775736.1 uncharacterized protein LOC110739587 [Chenopodium quinoa]